MDFQYFHWIRSRNDLSNFVFFNTASFATEFYIGRSINFGSRHDTVFVKLFFEICRLSDSYDRNATNDHHFRGTQNSDEKFPKKIFPFFFFLGNIFGSRSYSRCNICSAFISWNSILFSDIFHRPCCTDFSVNR